MGAMLYCGEAIQNSRSAADTVNMGDLPGEIPGVRRKMMEIYKKLATPPKDALKTIGGGRLKNMTDIKPQWRIEKMTEVFGACGIGWYPEITKQWTEDGCDGQRLSFCNINLYIKVDNEWSKPIPGTGGNMLTTKESKGLYSSDEAYKMAFTDALSVAMKLIGMGADIYRGVGLDSKYTQTIEQHVSEKPKSKSEIFASLINKIKTGNFDDNTMAQLQDKYAAVKTPEQGAALEAEVDKLLTVQKKFVDDFKDDDIPFEPSVPIV